jgi:serine/threonine-protein kinase
VIGACLAAAVVLGAAVTIAVWPRDTSTGPAETSIGPAPPSPGAPAPAQGPPATDISASQLRAILLTDNEIGSTSGGDSMVLESESAALRDDTATVSDAQCLGAWAPAQTTTYATSGETGVAVQQFRALNQSWQDGITQAVIAFSSQDKASTSWVNQRGQWSLCGGKTLTVTVPGQPGQSWDFGQPVTTSGVMTIGAALRGGTASCQHGIQVRGNVIIDIRQCRPNGSANVAALVTATAAKVPRQ